MDERISRRDFLNSTLLASGGLLMSAVTPLQLLGEADDWTGYGGVGDYSKSNGNTLEVLAAGHRIRDGEFERLPNEIVDTGEVFDCVVVGGGISGLAAALFFLRKSGKNRTCLVLDNHPVFGGEAKRNEFVVDGHRLMAHQGSAVFFVQYPHSFLGRFYDSIGLKTPQLQYQKWAGPAKEMTLSKTPYDMVGMEPATYGLYFGAKFGQKDGMWLIDPWGKKLEGAPISETARAELLKWRAGPQEEEKETAAVFWRRHFALSRFDHAGRTHDAALRHQPRNHSDFSLSGGRRRIGAGAGCSVGLCRLRGGYASPLQSDDTDQMFPGGNTGIARLMVKTLIPKSIAGDDSMESVCRNEINFAALDQPSSPARIRLNSTAVWVKHDGDPEKSESVSIVYTRAGKTYRVKARTVVMAGGGWTTKHVVRDLPQAQQQAYSQFYRSPCMMANVALRNWRFLYKMGITGFRWFEGVGNYTEVRKTALVGADSPTISPDSPVVLPLKVLYSYPGLPIADQGHRGRGEMLATPFSEYERQIREQFTGMFARSGFDARRDIAGIILNRWGHAYLNPQPGFFFGKDGKPAPAKFCVPPLSGGLLLPTLTWRASWTIAARYSRPSGQWGNCWNRF